MRLRIFSLVVFLLILLPSAFAFLSFLSFPPQPPAIFRLSDVNGEDVNVHNLNVEGDFNAKIGGFDVLFVTNMHVIDVNAIDLNVITFLNVEGDSNFVDVGISGQTFASDFVSLHADPTAGLHAATKAYVDKAVTGADFDLFLFEVASTDVGGYQQLKRIVSEQPEESDTETVNADNFLIQAFVTEQSDVNITTLSGEVYALHIHASAVTAGKQDARLFWRFFGRDPNGTEKQIGTDSEESPVLTSTDTHYVIHLNVSGETLVDGNRFVAKVFANLDGAGGDPDVTIFYEGMTSSRAEFKTIDFSQTSHDLLINREWSDANHSFILTGQIMDIGGYDFTTTGDSNLSDVTVGNLWSVDRIQCDNCTASGANSVALGDGSVASGASSFSFGGNASNSGSIALGAASTSSGASSLALGNSATASGTNAVAIGPAASATNIGSIAIGGGISSGSFGVAIGRGAQSIGADAISFGAGALAVQDAFAFGGTGVFSQAGGAFAGGFPNWSPPLSFEGIRALGTGSFAFGDTLSDGNITAGKAGSVAIGFSNDLLIADGIGAIALGYNVKSLGEASVALGKDITCYNDNQVCVQDLNVLGDANITNLSISGVTFSNDGIIVTGDSNSIKAVVAEAVAPESLKRNTDAEPKISKSLSGEVVPIPTLPPLDCNKIGA